MRRAKPLEESERQIRRAARKRRARKESLKKWALGIGAVLIGVAIAAALMPSLDPYEEMPLEEPLVSQVATSTAEPAVVEAVEPEPEPATTTKTGPLEGMVIVVDPGHQDTPNYATEPLGPGSTTMMTQDGGGTSGVASGVPEYMVNLQVSMKLQTALEEQGATVIMTRTTHSINLPNAERARIANDNNANLFLRIHCDGSADPYEYGLSVLVPGYNEWTSPIYEQSRDAGEVILEALIAETGAKNNGIIERFDLIGFNFARVPAVLVEMGFMTNADEDWRLNDPAYQDALVRGMVQGCINWLTR